MTPFLWGLLFALATAASLLVCGCWLVLLAAGSANASEALLFKLKLGAWGTFIAMLAGPAAGGVLLWTGHPGWACTAAAAPAAVGLAVWLGVMLRYA